MKGAVMVHSKRIEIGQRVGILTGLYASRFAVFKGRSRKQRRKVVVTPFLANTRILIEALSIRRAVVTRGATKCPRPGKSAKTKSS